MSLLTLLFACSGFAKLIDLIHTMINTLLIYYIAHQVMITVAFHNIEKNRYVILIHHAYLVLDNRSMLHVRDALYHTDTQPDTIKFLGIRIDIVSKSTIVRPEVQ